MTLTFIRCKLRIGTLSQYAGYTGYTWLSVGEGPIAEIVEYQGDRCRVIYHTNVDATIEMSANVFMNILGPTETTGHYGGVQRVRIDV